MFVEVCLSESLASICEQPPTPTNAAGLSFHDGMLIDSGRIYLLLRLPSGEVSLERSRLRRDQTPKENGTLPQVK